MVYLRTQRVITVFRGRLFSMIEPIYIGLNIPICILRQLLATPQTAAHQASLSFTISWSLLELMSIESVMPSNHLALCCPLLLMPSIFPSIRVFSKESVLRIRWPKYWSCSFNISPSNEYSGLISFRFDWFDLLAVQGTLKSLLQHYNSKTSLVAQTVKRLPAMRETWVRSLVQEDSWRRKWQPTPVSLPGESHGWRSLMQKLSEGDMGFNGKPFAGVTSETSNGTLFLKIGRAHV